MAKSKKNIDAFQQAMLNNTKMIGQDDEQSSEKKEKTEIKSENKSEPIKGLDQELFKQLEAMGNKYGIEASDLLNKGVKLFVDMEDFWFEE